MTGLVRKATLLAVCGLMVMAATALAGIPDPSKCTVPTYIDVVGTAVGSADARGTFTITVLDMNLNPVQNCQTILDFSACTDTRLCDAQLDTTKVVDCPTATVRGFTNASGQITFTVVGAAKNAPPPQAGAGAHCVNILAGGVSLGLATADVYDQNGAVTNNGVELTDVTAVLKDWGSGIYYGRSDLDKDSLLGLTDVIKVLKAVGDGTSANGCTTTYCP